MDLDPFILSRIHFAITIGFHFIFPSISIGLAWVLVVFEWKGFRNNDADFVKLGKFFGKLFALTFAIGVATGIVMEFQFGMNWARYSKFVGDIFGAPLAAEGIFAFFLESTFIGIYLFGRGKVSKGVHFFSILMVAFGATMSGFWILVANSWQHTPAGYVLKNGRAEMVDFSEAVFNPSMWNRFFHTIDSSIIAGAFFVAGISALLILRNQNVALAIKSLKISLIIGLVATILEIMPFGHMSAIDVEKYQPAKFAAMEGLYETQANAPVCLFGIPISDEPLFKAKLELPGALSLMLGHDDTTKVIGLEDIPEDERPNHFITYSSFHIMIGAWGIFMGLTGLGVFLMYRKKLTQYPLFLKALVLSIPIPIIAIQAGWVTTEVGRQPWVVQGILKTEDAFSQSVSGGEVLTSIILFSSLYVMLGALYLFIAHKEVHEGMED